MFRNCAFKWRGLSIGTRIRNSCFIALFLPDSFTVRNVVPFLLLTNFFHSVEWKQIVSSKKFLFVLFFSHSTECYQVFQGLICSYFLSSHHFQKWNQVLQEFLYISIFCHRKKRVNIYTIYSSFIMHLLVKTIEVIFHEQFIIVFCDFVVH